MKVTQLRAEKKLTLRYFKSNTRGAILPSPIQKRDEVLMYNIGIRAFVYIYMMFIIILISLLFSLQHWYYYYSVYSIKSLHLTSLRWWLHDPSLSGWNFNPSSWDRFHPTIAWENQISSQQRETVFHMVFV